MCFARLVPEFREGSATPRDLLERCLAAIAKRDGEVRAFVCVDATRARAEADRSTARYRANRPLSPVDGCPVGVKDIIETLDLPTQMNSPLFAGWMAGRDAACVGALKDGGAVILGKTVTTEFAAGASGPTRNPHDPRRTPGGSSSGSAAAVGAGMVPVALGTQTGGSILRPASYCGAYGFKPTHGALNIGGVHPVAPSQDHLGTIAGSLDDAWLVARHIARVAGGSGGKRGLSGPDQLPEPRRPRRLALLRTSGWSEVPTGVVAGFDAIVRRLRRAGVEIVDRLDDREIDMLEEAVRDATTLVRTFSHYEMQWPYRSYLKTGRRHLSPGIRSWIRSGRQISEAQHQAMLRRREIVRAQIAQLAGTVDGFINLASSGPAPLGLVETGSRSFLMPWSLAGTPSLALPLMHHRGLPVGIQLAGFASRDADIVAVAHWICREVGLQGDEA